MRLSELSNKKFAEVLLEISPCFDNIIADERISETYFDKLEEADIKGMNPKMAKVKISVKGALNISKMLRIVLKDHMEDVNTILSAINGVTKEEIENQSVVKTIYQLKQLLEDKELLNF